MANNGVPNLNFKEFVVESVEINCNAIQIVYGSGDP
jgi:hypothetical protein